MGFEDLDMAEIKKQKQKLLYLIIDNKNIARRL